MLEEMSTPNIGNMFITGGFIIEVSMKKKIIDALKNVFFEQIVKGFNRITNSRSTADSLFSNVENIEAEVKRNFVIHRSWVLIYLVKIQYIHYKCDGYFETVKKFQDFYFF